LKEKSGYIEISNLPRQIDNTFLKDLLKKEKDHLLDSYVIYNFNLFNFTYLLFSLISSKKTDSKGRVKLDSKESAERAISKDKQKIFANNFLFL